MTALAKRPPETPRIRASDGQPLRLDLGCGDNKAAGHIGIDAVKTASADHVLDLTQTPWPIDDASVDSLYCSHFFEHLTGAQRMAFMDECWRILKVGAQLAIIVPHWSSMRAVQDPTPPMAAGRRDQLPLFQQELARAEQARPLPHHLRLRFRLRPRRRHRRRRAVPRSPGFPQEILPQRHPRFARDPDEAGIVTRFAPRGHSQSASDAWRMGALDCAANSSVDSARCPDARSVLDRVGYTNSMYVCAARPRKLL